MICCCIGRDAAEREKVWLITRQKQALQVQDRPAGGYQRLGGRSCAGFPIVSTLICSLSQLINTRSCVLPSLSENDILSLDTFLRMLKKLLKPYRCCPQLNTFQLEPPTVYKCQFNIIIILAHRMDRDYTTFYRDAFLLTSYQSLFRSRWAWVSERRSPVPQTWHTAPQGTQGSSRPTPPSSLTWSSSSSNELLSFLSFFFSYLFVSAVAGLRSWGGGEGGPEQHQTRTPSPP